MQLVHRTTVPPKLSQWSFAPESPLAGGEDLHFPKRHELRLVIAALPPRAVPHCLAQNRHTAKPDFTAAWKLREEVADAEPPQHGAHIAHRGSSFELP